MDKDLFIKDTNMLSRIGLGTVQFGLDYGIANRRGRIAPRDVVRILDWAAGVGISVLDTASAYGDSEEVIGQYQITRTTGFRIYSKMTLSAPGGTAGLVDILKSSLSRLKVSSLEGYLVHSFADFLHDESLWPAMRDLRSRGLARKIGFSLYLPSELETLWERGTDFDVVQVPYSLFDRRFEKYFERLKQAGVDIQVRSVFLQGLAFLAQQELPSVLGKAQGRLQTLRQLARENDLTIASLCLNFALLNDCLDHVIIGVDGLDQLQDNVAAVRDLDKVKALLPQLRDMEMQDEEVILPFRWPQRQNLVEETR